MAAKSNLKKKVMRQAAKSASGAKSAAKQQLDQVLLKLEHPAVKKVSDKFKANEAGDIIVTLTQRILEQAQAIRASLDPAVIKPMASELGSQMKGQVKAAAKNPRKTLRRARKMAKNMATNITKKKRSAS